MSNWVQKDAAELPSISPRVMNKIKTPASSSRVVAARWRRRIHGGGRSQLGANRRRLMPFSRSPHPPLDPRG
jgi:hypothetical protein